MNTVSTKTLYLNIVWHQHQPLYLDPESDQLQGPWVRTHGTKDYYDMVSILEQYPNIHFTVNLTSSLMHQLEKYYVERLSPFVDIKNNTVNAKKYFDIYGGRTDPWIDIALKDTQDLNEDDLKYLLTNSWNAFGVSEVIISRFPEYKNLRDKYYKVGKNGLTLQEIREIKFWFYIAYFDPDFIEAPYHLVTGNKVDVTDIIQKNSDGTYTLKKQITEKECNRIIAETYKILSAIIPIHKKMMFHPNTHKGQVEIITTPYYHPILPLIYDTNIANVCQPNHKLPSLFHYPIDAEIQVAKSMNYFKKIFGIYPVGMWPGEGSVSQEVLPVFAHNGIKWIATDQKILERSNPNNMPCYYPYAVIPDNKKLKEAVIIVFRETELSDKIGFVYKNYKGCDAAEDFINSVLKYAPNSNEPDRLLTVILDGENAWEWFYHDNDGKEFQHSLYKKLSELYKTRQIVTTTVTEYILGNPLREIPAHPIEVLPKINWLWPGSWINANYDTWIGESEKNKAWEYLLTARIDLENSGIKQPNPNDNIPKENTKEWYEYMAWESLYAAEGSDWFWWYGTDQNTPSGVKPFDVAFITHIKNIYQFAKLAGATIAERIFTPIARSIENQQDHIAQSAMVKSNKDLITVRFVCNASNIYARKSIFIVGNHPLLGNWIPNKIKMTEDKLHPEKWIYEAQLPVGSIIEYKYTNSGAEGEWKPGEEFPFANRKLVVTEKEDKIIIVNDTFGSM